jgi:hypothetical protein
MAVREGQRVGVMIAVRAGQNLLETINYILTPGRQFFYLPVIPFR